MQLASPVLTAPSQPVLEPSGPWLRSLYICYYPLSEPLVQTQVVAYLSGLAALGHTIHLLTYETEPLTPAQKRAWRRKLKARGITWHMLRYHKRPSLPATAYDALCGIWLGMRLLRRHRLQAIHARAHVPGAMGWVLKKLTGARLIFDIRGLWAEEYEDAGIWRRDSLPFRITKATERACIEASDGLVVLTQSVRKVLFDGQDDPRLQVIPCCADLSLIEAQASERDAMRQQLGVQDKTVLIYVGKFGGRYLQKEMTEFFTAARDVIPNLFFLVLTQSDPDLIGQEFARRQVPAGQFAILQSPPEKVGEYLAAADVALSLVEAFPSTVAMSPTKLGEYLAAGLPVVCSPGIGDVDAILTEHRVGVSVQAFDEAAYREAAQDVLSLLEDNAVRERCRSAAHATASLQEIGVPRYHQLYVRVARLAASEPGA